MKFIYETIVNALLFFFFLQIFNGIKITAAGTDIWASVMAGLIFGLLIASIPSILKFFKLPVNLGGTFLLALVFVFIFLFLLQQNFMGLGSVGSTTLNLGDYGGKIVLKGAIQTMVAATVTISLSVLGLKSLSKSSKSK